MEEEPIGSSPTPFARLFPAARMAKGVSISFDGRSMILAAIGLILLWGGWRGLDLAFGARELAPLAAPELSPMGFADGPIPWAQASRASRPFFVVIAPFVRLFSIEPGPRGFWHAALAAAWCAAVWGIVGGAIVRVAVLRLSRGERVGIATALRFAVARGVALIGAPLSPLIAIGFFAALCGLMGLLYRVPGPIGAGIAGVFAFLPLVAGLVMSLILAGMALGWPLMIATVSVEDEDAFDALSRAYSYLYQRPARYAAYAAIAWLGGWAGSVVVGSFASLIVHMAEWGLTFGAPARRVASLYAGENPASSTPAMIHWFWISALRWLAHAWLYSYFWTAATMVYLLLRHDVDGAPYHDVAAVDGAEESFVPDPPGPEKVEAAE